MQVTPPRAPGLPAEAEGRAPSAPLGQLGQQGQQEGRQRQQQAQEQLLVLQPLKASDEASPQHLWSSSKGKEGKSR